MIGKLLFHIVPSVAALSKVLLALFPFCHFLLLENINHRAKNKVV